MVFVMVHDVITFVLFDKTTSTDVKYQSKRCVSMIEFSCADKILSSGFYRKFFDSSYFYAMRQSFYLAGTVYEMIVELRL